MAARLLNAGFNVDESNLDKEEALFWAAKNGEKDAVRLLLDMGVDIVAEDKDERTALHYAGEYGQSDIADLILKAGASVDTRTNEGQTALALAARFGHDATIQVLLHGHADIEAKDNDGVKPIHLAARNGYRAVIKLLLDKKANISARDADEWTALHYAARNGHETMVRLLIDRKADIDARSKTDQTPLMFAAQKGRELIFRILLNNKADISAQDTSGLTALHYAARHGHEAIFRLLLNNNANISVQANDGWTVLQSAAEFGHYALVKLLLDRGADLELRDKKGWTALCYAVRFGHEAIVALLLDRNADLEARDKEEKTPLHIAAKYKHEAVVRLLLDKNADISARATTQKMTVLQHAALSGHSAIVELLLDRKADILARDSGEWTALHYAIQYGHEPIVRLLLDRGADIEARDAHGHTALFTAARRGEAAITRLLLDRNADLEALDNNKHTALQFAPIYGERVDPVIRLLQAKKDEILALEAKQPLKREKSDINSANQQKLEALISAVENGDKDDVKQLLQPVTTMMNETGQQWPSLLTKAIERGHEDVAKLLLDAGVEKDAKRLTTALGYAAKEGMGNVFSLLLAHGADISAEDALLCWAAEGGDASIVRLVLSQTNKRGINSHASGLTPLLQACYSDQFAAAQLLIEAGADIEAFSSSPYSKRTPLWHASLMSGWRMMQMLIEKGANIHVQELGWQYTILHSVCLTGSPEFQKKIRLLLDSGASLTTKDKKGRNALQALIQSQNIEGTQLALLKVANNGPELAQADNNGQTVLHYAVIHGGIEFVSLLLEKGAPIESRDADGRTPLAVAVRHGFETIVRRLVDSGASTTVLDNKEMTPLMIAAEARELLVLQFLLTLKPDLDWKDSEGRTALHLATVEGFLDAVSLLLEAGSDPKLVDGNGYTAMDLAKKYKHGLVLNLLRHGKLPVLSAPASSPLDSIDPENKTFQHPVLEGNRSIRVLILEPGELTDPVCCSLKVVSLDDPKLEYEALSYVWGTEPVSREIRFRVPDSKFYVRDNLLSALIRLRRREAPRKLWIDAICIDQNNRGEQGQQVQLMTDVYSRASEVAIWLGKDDSYVVPTFKEMKDTCTTSLDDGDFRESRGKPKWPAALVQFFQNPWFERAWIFQEIICSKKATLYSGLGENPGKNEYGHLDKCRNNKPWSLVSEFYNFTGEIEMLENLPTGYTSVMGPLTYFQKIRVDKDGTIRGFDLLRLLELRRDSKATQAVDKIYSLLGLSTQGQAGLLRANYDLDPATLYPTVAKLLMTSRSDLRLLSAVQHQSPDLPSWVPDWREPWRTKPLVFQPWHVTSTFRPKGSSTSPGDESSPYKAAEGCQIDIQEKDDKHLKVKGRNFSRIDMILDFAAGLLDVATTPDGIAAQIELKGFPLGSKYPIADGNYLDAVCETIIADLNLTNREKDGITHSKNKSILDCLELRKEVNGAVTSRRLFLTANGFVGLGPADAAVGDTICLLFGGSVMYVVRQETLGIGDHRFIGECYCHGVMNGEAVSMGEESDDLYYTFH